MNGICKAWEREEEHGTDHVWKGDDVSDDTEGKGLDICPAEQVELEEVRRSWRGKRGKEKRGKRRGMDRKKARERK